MLFTVVTITYAGHDDSRRLVSLAFYFVSLILAPRKAPKPWFYWLLDVEMLTIVGCNFIYPCIRSPMCCIPMHFQVNRKLGNINIYNHINQFDEHSDMWNQCMMLFLFSFPRKVYVFELYMYFSSSNLNEWTYLCWCYLQSYRFKDVLKPLCYREQRVAIQHGLAAAMLGEAV